VLCFLGVAATFSANLRAVSWRNRRRRTGHPGRPALFILKLQIGDVRPGYLIFEFLGGIVAKFLEFTDSGSQFVFGRLASREAMDRSSATVRALSSPSAPCRRSSSCRRSSPCSTTSACCSSS
jgi:nucleoside permease NupC